MSQSGRAVQTLQFTSNQEVKIGENTKAKKVESNAPRLQVSGEVVQETNKIMKQRQRDRDAEKYKKSSFNRGSGNDTASIKKIADRRMRDKFERAEFLSEAATKATHDASEVLLLGEQGFIKTEGRMQTSQLRQADILEHAPEGARSKAFSLDLPNFGPYHMDYTKNGRFILLGGTRGQISLFDWHKKSLFANVQCKETIRDVKFLHDETMFAVARKDNVFVYDKDGTELHCLKTLPEPKYLEFLPYHFLLCTMNEQGRLVYQDTATGQVVSKIKRHSRCTGGMVQNPQNAVIYSALQNGRVALWTPSSPTPAAEIWCHFSSLSSIAIDQSGHYLATAAVDNSVSIYDIRMYKELRTFKQPTAVRSLSFSATGKLAMGLGSTVQIIDNPHLPSSSIYLQEPFRHNVSDVLFCPYEDVLGVCHEEGYQSMLVPGSGEANFDSYVANPFQSSKQRSNHVVRKLLEKLQPDMITLQQTALNDADPIFAKHKSMKKTKKVETVVEEEDKVNILDEEEKFQKAEKRKKTVSERAKTTIKLQDFRKKAVDQAIQDKITEISNSKAPTRLETKIVPNALDRFKD